MVSGDEGRGVPTEKCDTLGCNLKVWIDEANLSFKVIGVAA